MTERPCQTSVVEVDAPVAGSATAGVPVLAAAMAPAAPATGTVADSVTVGVLMIAVAEVHAAVLAAPAAAHVADSCDHASKHYSSCDHHCRHAVPFAIAHSPSPGHSSADEP